MKLTKSTKLNWIYTALAFIWPVLGLFVLMIIRGFIPFGNTSMLYSDMYHQYYPFFVSFREALLSGESLLYSWDVGLGMDYLGLIAYYLGSPLNLLSILVPENLTLAYFSLLAPLKIGFAGLFFAVLLKNLFHKNDLSISVFGCFYGLCAWALGYHWNVMWLDTFALLPLVVLGTVCLLRDKKFILYTVGLFFSIVSNYYIGLFTCIFVALVFICYEICRWNGFVRFLADFGRLALFSILAVGMTAFLELPAYAALQRTQSSVNTFPEGCQLNIADENTWKGLLGAMRQVAGGMNGGLVPNYKDYDALPNIYCGIASTVFALLFLTCKEIRLRDKLCSVLLLLFLNLSFIIRHLDYMWHGFHFTNMIPYRFSFLYSFVVLYMAYRAYTLRHSFKLWQLLIALSLALCILFSANMPQDIPFWAYNVVFLLLYFAALLYPQFYLIPRKDAPRRKKYFIAKARTERRHMSSSLLIGIMCMELILNLVNFGVDFAGTSVDDYPRGTENSKAMLEYAENRSADELFYRIETAHPQTLNDGALNGYHGITTFTSSANVQITRFMQVLGYGAKDTYNRYAFEDSSPVANLFLNLRYMLDRQGNIIDNPYFDRVNNSENVYLLENNAYLPLGFLADSQILNTDFESAYNEATHTPESWNSLHFQNKLFRYATGTEQDVWSFLIGNQLSITSDDLIVYNTTQTGSCDYTADELASGTLVYRYEPSTSGYMCLDLYAMHYNSYYAASNSFSVWKNGEFLCYYNYSLPQTIGVAAVKAGDVVEVRVDCIAGEEGHVRVHAAILNEDVFRAGYNTLSQSVLELTEFRNTHITGTINCNRSGVLYTSIPQNGNWTAAVDGKPVSTIEIGDAMVGLLLSEGYHTIEFSYQNKAFQYGLIISSACLLIFTAAFFILYKPKYSVRRKGRFQR